MGQGWNGGRQTARMGRGQLRVLGGWRLWAGAAMVAAATGLPAVPPASGQASVTYSFTPQAGPVGTVVRFSGTGCPPGERLGASSSVDGRFEIFRSVDGTASGPYLTFKTFVSNPDGTFGGETSPLPDGPLGSHRTNVSCGNAFGPDFVLTAAAVTTTSTKVAATGGGTTSTTLAAGGPGGGTGGSSPTASAPRASEPTTATPATPVQGEITLTG